MGIKVWARDWKQSFWSRGAGSGRLPLRFAEEEVCESSLGGLWFERRAVVEGH